MSDMERLKKMADIYLKQKAAVDQAEKDLKAAKDAYRRTRTEDLPELMCELGFKTLELFNGETLEVKEEVSCGITQEKAPAAYSWLEDHGFGGIIKTLVTVSFGADEFDQAVQYRQTVEDSDYQADLKRSVHAGTLKSFVKEQLEEGNNIPFDLFSIHPYNVVDVKKKGK